MASETAPYLVVGTRTDDHCFVVRLAGELDGSNRHLVAEACAGGGDRRVVVDLSELTFMDCGGYGALIAAEIAAVGRGATMQLQHLVGQPARLVDRLGGRRTGPVQPASPETPVPVCPS